MRALILILLAPLVSAQPFPSREEGAPLSERHSWRDYSAHFQNWAVVQDDQGVVYAANTDGVLEYDGHGWRLHPLPDSERLLVRSLALDSNGTIYVGGIGFIGRLRADSTESLSVESLNEWIPESHRDFSDVWTTFATPMGVVFQSSSHLFRWNGEQVDVWRTETRFHKAFQVGEEVIVREEGIGLRSLKAHGLEDLPGGSAFADRKVFALLPHETGMLAAVVDEGLVLLSVGKETPISGVASAYLRSFRPYAGEIVENAYGDAPLYSFATFGGGVLVVDSEGQPVRVYREDAGLKDDDFVVGMTTDRQGGLWLALLDGLLRLDLFGQVTTFGEAQGLPRQAYSAARHNGTLYIGTVKGLHRLTPGGSGIPGRAPSDYSRIEPVDETLEQIWALASVGGDLLIGTNRGVSRLQGRTTKRVQQDDDTAFALHVSPWSPHDVLVGMKNGVALLRQSESGWHDLGYLTGIEGEVRSLASSATGDVWAALMNGGVARIRRGRDGEITARSFREGFAPGTVVTEAGGEAVVNAGGGIGRLVMIGDRIRVEPVEWASRSDGSLSLAPRDSESFWIIQNEAITGGRLEGDRFIQDETMRFEWALPVGAYTEPDGVTWVLTDDGVIRYDPRIRPLSSGFPAFVRRVAEANGPRRTLYGGALTNRRASTEPVLTLPFATNDLRFEYSAAAFLYPDLTEYQTLLEGQQDTWTPWGREALADFTNLHEGTYTFRVRARDALGRLSDEAVFTFRIAPPWYRTVWAYLGYCFAIAFLLWTLLTWQVRKQRRKLAAHRVRNARATRLNSRLQEINARLRHADKLKDDLLANTSHELRTPLTAVLGYAELLLDETEGETHTLAEGVWRGGNRLLSTVNSLLDMYKLQAGSMELRPAALDVGEQIRETVRLLEPLALDRNIALVVLPDGLAIPAEVDRAALDRIVTNLVGNAIKFTDSGAVTVLLDADHDHLHLTVRDTGVGIGADFLPRLFEPFEQASTGHGRSHEGSGLGLAIVKRLVELSHGSIEVESEVDVGTAFHISLPRYAASGALSQTGEPAPPAAMGGAEVLAITSGGELASVLKGVVEPHGRVCVVSSGIRAAREARRTAFDLVIVEAGHARDEMRHVEAVRRVPGYEHSAIIRAGGEALGTEPLEARGFSHQVTEITNDALVFGLLEGLLMKVEAALPVEE